ncbi:hypothetical protein ABEY96_28900 [Priestia aryabhattai]|uniref:hypothetical protein n=1 Tax=Priestia aryabhattai TaxID=412384 RepID=UPI003D281589
MNKWDVFFRGDKLLDNYVKMDVLEEVVLLPIMINKWINDLDLKIYDKYIVLGLMEHSFNESLSKSDPDDFDISVALPNQLVTPAMSLEDFGSFLFVEKYRFLRKIGKQWMLGGFMATLVGSEDLHNPTKMRILDVFQEAIDIVRNLNQRELLEILAVEWGWDSE